MSSKSKAIGIFGGTFDPIHFGHLRAALEIYQALKLDEMRLIPCQNPPHRVIPIAEGRHRLKMASLAVLDSVLQVDDQEMKREGPSYTIDTLMCLRKTYPFAKLYMVVGGDAFLSLPSWYQWEKLIQLTNIVIINRMGWVFPEQGEMVDFLKKYSHINPDDNIHQFSSGKIITQSITSLDIQASRIRSMIALGESPQFLLPKKVLEYIREHGLYKNVHKDD